ncbi:MAG TPA: CpsD/CapB family tyrosine-protein kinase [Acidimicrobiales bacterium]|nr:CpsD/CapB family tyrosine-protein kinase [Acidimicrobiales bacterium]
MPRTGTSLGDELTLSVVAHDLLRRWKVAIAVLLAFAAGAIAYAEQLPDQFQGKAVMAFAPRKDVNIGGDIVRQVLPKYVSYATAAVTLDRVAARIGEKPDTLRTAVKSSVSVDSGNLSITVQLGSGERAANAANAVAQEVLTFSDTDPLLSAVIVSPAVPDAPSGPPRRLIEAAALLVGVLLGGVVAFLVERSWPRIRSPRDAALITGYPLLGRVPASKQLQRSPATAMEDPAVGSAIRTLRTSLERASREKPVHVLMVTSAISGEGKTTLASCLARSFALLDAEVLLVDADLRRPSIDRAFDLTPKPGLADLLRGRATLGECLRDGGHARLHVLPTAVDPEAGDLLARRFVELMRIARGQADVIVVDAPPILGTDDARTLAAMCDGVVMVVGVGTHAEPVSEAASALDALGVRVLGVVANRSREPAGTYGSYGLYLPRSETTP